MVITCSGISKRFPTVLALDTVSFSVPEHSIFGILGPNGAGKTTLFSVLSGFIRPDSGSFTVLGTSNIRELQGRIGVLPQDAFFQSNIPILYQLRFFLQLLGWSKEQADSEVARVMRLVELDTALLREATTLSHGMFKRLALAQAFLGSPELVILDEPTAGLDWKSAKKIRETILELKRGATILISSHNMNEMHELCDHVGVLREGRLVSVGPVEEVTGTSVSMTLALDRPLSPEELTTCSGLEGVFEFSPAGEKSYRVFFDVNCTGEELTASVKRLQKTLIDTGVMIKSLQEDNRLEELYLQVTGTPGTDTNPERAE
jgi:ABC-2 type transport system ATP-binding protein